MALQYKLWFTAFKGNAVDCLYFRKLFIIKTSCHLSRPVGHFLNMAYILQHMGCLIIEFFNIIHTCALWIHCSTDQYSNSKVFFGTIVKKWFDQVFKEGSTWRYHCSIRYCQFGCNAIYEHKKQVLVTLVSPYFRSPVARQLHQVSVNCVMFQIQQEIKKRTFSTNSKLF